MNFRLPPNLTNVFFVCTGLHFVFICARLGHQDKHLVDAAFRLRGASSKMLVPELLKGSRHLSQKTMDNSEDIEEEVAEERPTIYTFFEPIGKSGSDPNDSHQQLVQEWKFYWYTAGWNPVVLSLGDAKKHPDFDHVWDVITEQGYNTYEVLCYIRWLAITAAGGGWMSDYDTLPLHDFREDGLFLPSGGNFTVYEHTVPSLISGSQEEWQRVTNAIVDNLAYKVSHPNEIPSQFLGIAFSDMVSLLDLYQTDNSIFLSQNQVLSKFTSIMETAWTADDCDTLVPQNMRAVHFAHYYSDIARKQGFFQKVEERDDWDVNMKRVAMIRWWMRYWKDHCKTQIVH